MVEHLIVGIIVALIGVAIYTARQVMVAHLDERQLILAAEMAGIAVTAAEQMYAKQPGMGAEKLSYALGQIVLYLERRGIQLDEGTLRVLVESAVYGLLANAGSGEQWTE